MGGRYQAPSFFHMMCISLALFAVTHELVLYGYSRKNKKISLKEIMLE